MFIKNCLYMRYRKSIEIIRLTDLLFSWGGGGGLIHVTQPTFQTVVSPSQRRGAPFRALAWGEGTNFARLFTPGEREALAKSKVYQ